jgi:hypothetical protein
MSGAFTASNARAISHSRFSKFEETEKSVKKYPFNNFYTSKDLETKASNPVLFHKENRFEGKSSYLAYYPTG